MTAINKNLTILLSGQLVSQIGDKFYAIAIAFWVLDTTGSPALMSVILFSQMMSTVVTGLFAGSIVDTFNKKNIIVLTDIFRGIIMLIFTMLFYLSYFNLAIIIVIEILLGINTAFFNTAIPAALPQIVNEEDLSKANSKMQLIYGGASILGPILGGVTTAAFGFGFAFIINSLSFLISGFFEMLMKLPFRNTAKQCSEKIFVKLIEGYKYIYNSGQIILILLVIIVVHLFYGSILIIMPVMANEISGNGARLLGIFQSALGIGTILSSSILCFYKIKGNEDKYMFIGVFGIGISLFFMGLSFFKSNFLMIPFLFIFFIFLGCSVAFTSINFKVLLQKKVNSNMIGRVFGVITTIADSSMPIAMLVFGFLLDLYSSNILLLYSGITLVIVNIILVKIYFTKRKISLFHKPLIYDKQ